MRMGDFLWERNGNGEYEVTYKRTGQTITAIPQLGKQKRYCIRESDETELNVYGQKLPKRYNRFEVMAYCADRAPSAKVDAPMREVVSDA